jgi:hypothetical protein
MRPSLVIPRIRAQCSIFANRVAGAATYRQVSLQDDFPAPHAFVLPLGELADGEVMISTVDQELATRFAVVVAVSNTSDERGQAAAEAIYDIRASLLTALVGWTPDATRYAPVLYRGMPDDPDVNRARAWAQFDFEALAYTATAA